MVFDLDCEPLVLRIEGRALGDGPGFENAAAKPRIWKSAGRAQSRSDGISPSMAVAGTFKAPAGSEQAGASTSQASYFLTGDQVVVELSYL